MSNDIIMYSTQWCGDCRAAKRFLREHNITYSEIDIDANNDAAQRVIDWSGGRRVIPTFVIQKCEASKPVILHNPSASTLTMELGL